MTALKCTFLPCRARVLFFPKKKVSLATRAVMEVRRGITARSKFNQTREAGRVLSIRNQMVRLVGLLGLVRERKIAAPRWRLPT